MAVRQVGTESWDKEELAYNEDQCDGSHTEQVFYCRVMAYHQMAGNGVEQHFQTAAGAVLGQHLDELNADHDVKAPLQKNADLHFVAVKQQAGHPLDERHSAQQQADEHKAGEQNFQQTGGLNDAIAQLGAPAAFHMRGGIVHIEPSFAKKVSTFMCNIVTEMQKAVNCWKIRRYCSLQWWVPPLHNRIF